MFTFRSVPQYRKTQDGMVDQSKSASGEPMELQAAILLALQDYVRRSVISTNHVMKRVRELCPDCTLEDKVLARLIQEAAMLLGLVPVFDPSLGQIR